MYSNPLFRFTPGQKDNCSGPRPYPNSTLKKIVFPLNKAKNEFDVNIYQPEMSHNLLSRLDIDTFFRNLYSHADYFNFHQVSYLNKLTRFAILVPVSLFISFLGIHLLFFSQSQTTNKFLIMVELISFVWAALGVVNVMRTHKRIEFNTRLRIGEYLNQQNMGYFSQKGMKWKAPPDHFNYIELDFDYKTSTEKDSYFKVLEEMVSSELAVVIFPLNEQKCAFEHQFFNPEIADNRLAKSDVEIFLHGIEETIGQELSKLKKRKLILPLFLVALVLGLVGLALIHQSSDSVFLQMERVLLALYFVMIWTVFILLQNYFGNLQTEIKAKLGEEVQQENAGIISQGVRWYVPADEYRWLELWLDYRFINEEVELPKEEKEEEDVHKYRFREAETLPLYQWGKQFNFNFRPRKNKDMDYMNVESLEDQEKLFIRSLFNTGKIHK